MGLVVSVCRGSSRRRTGDNRNGSCSQSHISRTLQKLRTRLYCTTQLPSPLLSSPLTALHRYRVLFNTLLAGSPNIEDGLVQEDSPFAGSKRFGMCYLDEKGRLAAIGTTLEIQDYARESGGRM